ncbi:cell wall-binding repeat-containing protein [Candidatus Poriferisodalis sp.]|uniref:cell wall-binding repeat-containing protein n=1 Tax=Candidatus Poriferisodalis sp. TaxID=3101277 RepID=UPI003B01A66B
MRRPSVIVLALLAALLALGGVAVPPASAAAAEHHVAIEAADSAPNAPADDGSDVSITRYGGADRYETSLRIAEAVAAEAGGSLEWVVLVSGERWTDAVVAAPLAGARNAPVLLTPPHELRHDALEFLQRVGVSLALVVGPDATGGVHGPGRGVAESVLADLAAAGIAPQRVTGVDRHHTSRVVAATYGPRTMGDLGSTAIVASGEVFADALVAGPFAARGHHPVLLTPPDELYPEVARYLQSVRIEHVVLMGGTAALSEAVEQSIKDLGINVTRVAGATRYDTAVKAAELAADRYTSTAGEPCFATSTVGIARARVPFDSFSAAPLLARLCAPLVLADPKQIPPDTAAYLDAAREAHDTVDLRVFGGDAAVSGAAIDAYRTGTEPVADTGGTGEEAGGADAGDIEITPIGRGVSITSEYQIIIELQPSDVEPANPLDLSNRTLVFTPNANGDYSRQVLPLSWEPDFRGERYRGSAEIELQHFPFEFSGESWRSFHLSQRGLITFGEALPESDPVRFGTMPRYADFIVRSATPTISALYKPTLWGSFYVTELSDRVIITWLAWDPLLSPYGQRPEQTFDVQMVLHSDGRVAFNYGPDPANPDEAFRDGVVGLFQVDQSTGAPRVEPGRMADLSDPDTHFSPVQIEAFRYHAIERGGDGVADISCRIIDVLGNEFDFFALNSQSRVDQQEAGTPSNIFRGNIQAAIQGTGLKGHLPTTPCQSRLKTAWLFPIWMKARTVVNEDYMRYGHGGPYDVGLTLFAHELAHVWTAFASYETNGNRVPLHDAYCDCHWLFELHAPAAFPWRGSEDGSIMGGAFWREHPDGSFSYTDGWKTKAGGFSWLDLYLMGLAAPDEVPDMFILRDRQLVGNHTGVYTGTKEVVTLEQIIAATGVRKPPADEARREFNMGFVYLLWPGETVDLELLREHADYRDRAVDHWHHITGGRGRLTSTLP